MQNAHSFTVETNAAISSRSPTDHAEGPRIASWVSGMRTLGWAMRIEVKDSLGVILTNVRIRKNPIFPPPYTTGYCRSTIPS